VQRWMCVVLIWGAYKRQKELHSVWGTIKSIIIMTVNSTTAAIASAEGSHGPLKNTNTTSQSSANGSSMSTDHSLSVGVPQTPVQSSGWSSSITPLHPLLILILIYTAIARSICNIYGRNYGYESLLLITILLLIQSWEGRWLHVEVIELDKKQHTIQERAGSITRAMLHCADWLRRRRF